MQIFDCFTFNDEVEVLTTRILYLESVVNFFVIAESNRTFSGIEKKYYADQVIQNSGIDPERFIRVKYEFPQEMIEKAARGGDRWPLERHARQSLSSIIHNINSTDFVLLSDVDEIPSTEQITKASKLEYLIRVSTPVYHGKLNWKVRGNDPWLTVKMGPSRFFRDLNSIRYAVVPEVKAPISGIHFSDMYGQIEDVQRKAQSSAHSEFDLEGDEFKKLATYADFFKTEYRGRFFRKGMGLVSVTKDLNKLQTILGNVAPKFLDSTPTPSFYSRVCASYNLTLAWKKNPVRLEYKFSIPWFLHAITQYFVWRLWGFTRRVARRIGKLGSRN